MEVELKRPIEVIREKIVLLRFAFDNELRKMQIEATNEKYNSDGVLINSQPVRLIFRNEKYDATKDFCFDNLVMNKIINMLLRKLEIDRHLEDNALCDSFPQDIPPYKEDKKND